MPKNVSKNNINTKQANEMDLGKLQGDINEEKGQRDKEYKKVQKWGRREKVEGTKKLITRLIDIE